MSDLAARVAGLPWETLGAELDARGFVTTGSLLDAAECAGLAAMYSDEGRFRSRVDMARYRFGLGEYKYFAAPLPEPVAALREAFYPPLAPIANRWMERPTPLLLHYTAGGYNCLHQDLYGAVAFPLQATVLLSDPAADFAGGEFLLVEQRPRAQSAGHVVPLRQGETVLFATRHRPAHGARGWYRAQLRHGVSEVRSGERYTLGVIFHDAE